MLEDSINTVKAILYERVANPFLRSYLVSWCIWNYKFILILLSSENIDSKFFLIGNLYSDYFGQKAVWMLVLPAASAAVYLLLLPLPVKFFYKKWSENQRDLIVIKKKIEDETPISQEEARQLRAKIFQLEIEYDNRVKEFRNFVEVNKSVGTVAVDDPASKTKSGESVKGAINRIITAIDAFDSSGIDFSFSDKYRKFIDVYEQHAQVIKEHGNNIEKSFLDNIEKHVDRISLFTGRIGAHVDMTVSSNWVSGIKKYVEEFKSQYYQND